MIFRRALVSELNSTAGAVFTVLFTIIFSVTLVRILGDAAVGRIDSGAVFSIVALSGLTNLPVVLTLTVFIAVLMTLTRAYRDMEMVIWFANGQSLLAWLRPVLRFALPVVLLVAVLSVVVMPWANQQITESRERFARRDDVAKVSPGRFVESAAAERVFFVENVDAEGAVVRNVFVSHRSQGRDGVIVAADGVIERSSDGVRYLVLSRGRRYEGTPGLAEYRVVEFERYAIRLDGHPDAPIRELSRTRLTVDLVREPTRPNQAELLWRLGLPAIALVLAIMAIPLSHINPRVGRSANLIVALLLFLLYLNGMWIMQAQVLAGHVSFATGVWLTHAVAGVLALALFARRLRLQSGWLPRLGRRRGPGGDPDPAAGPR
jgi:lipopolysaccharide export system permease protein